MVATPAPMPMSGLVLPAEPNRSPRDIPYESEVSQIACSWILQAAYDGVGAIRAALNAALF